MEEKEDGVSLRSIAHPQGFFDENGLWVKAVQIISQPPEVDK